MKRFIVSFLCVCIFSVAMMSQPNYSFTTINKDNGLLDNYVEQVFEDSRGFIWFATHEGLCRYDGNSFEHFELPNIGNLKIARNFISSLVEDNNHNLWIGTLSGIYILNQETRQISFLKELTNNSLPLQHSFVEQIVFDNMGRALIGTREGFSIFDPKTKSIQNFFHDDKNRQSISNNFIYSICCDSQGSIWLGTRDGGLDKLANDGKSFIHFYNKPNGLNDLHIRCVFEDSKKNLWVLSAQSGLYKKNNSNDGFEKISLIDNRIGKEYKSLFQNLNEDLYGNIWISTASDGIVIYNPKTQNCEMFTDNSLTPQRIAGNSVEFISHDRQGNMWLATHGGGASIFRPMTSWFRYYTKNEDTKGLQGNLVSSFCQDKSGMLWVGTDGNGFAKYNMANGFFQTFTKDNGLPSNAVLDICEIKPNQLAIATYSGGLSVYNTQLKTFKQYLYKTNRSDGNLQNIYGLHFDNRKNLLWCNTFGDGIKIFDCNAMRYLTEKEIVGECAFPNCTDFSQKSVFDKTSNLWIAGGYQLFRINKNKLTEFSKSDSTKKQEPITFITDVLSDSKNTIWITAYQGLFKLDNKNDRFVFFNKTDCDFRESRGLLEDAVGNIWITTVNGIFKYNKKSGDVSTISQQWGMPQMQYFRKSTFRTNDGHLLFGGLKGFVAIDEKAKRETVKPKMYLTKLFINEVEQKPNDSNSVLKKDISFLHNLELNYNRNYITIEFAAINYIDNAKSKFKYMLKGLNNTWVEVQKDRKAQFTNLTQGNYTFLLKTTDSNGEWIEQPLTFEITILPPWWKSWWFRIVLIVALLFAMYSFIKFRVNAIKQKNKELEVIVKRRTAELHASNENLRIQKATIQEQYESIKENQFVIELKNKQLVDAIEMKDKLLTVIAHDFKNPLTSLQGSLKSIQKKVTENGIIDIQKQVDSVVSSSTKLMEQMVNILDWTLGNDKSIIHVPIETNLDNVIADVLMLVNDFAQRKSISISSKSSCKSHAYVDVRMITVVVRNIIINAIKYTDDNGKIVVRTKETDEHIICEIEDNGIGMEQEYIDKILSSTDLVAENYQTGLGLMICKNFITRNKGTLAISSKINEGTIFKIILPKGIPLQISENEKKEIIETAIDKSNAELSMLIIDDNKDIIGYLGEEFADNYSVYGAYDGKKGLQIARNVVPDIILCDVNMPVIDGITFCKMMKSDSLTSHIPIVLVSAKSLQADQIEGLKSGADDYITKPFDIKILKQKIESILINRKLLDKRFIANKTSLDNIHLPESYNDKITNEARLLILQNLNNPNFSVDTMAKQLCLSRSQLYRKFVSVLGQTPKEYILTIKFEKAIEMLKTKKYRVSDIAFELGFTDSHYFSVSFTQRFGVSPSNYFPKDN